MDIERLPVSLVYGYEPVKDHDTEIDIYSLDHQDNVEEFKGKGRVS